MSCLPSHGRVACTLCFPDQTVTFDVTRRSAEGWRISANPLAWGNTSPEIVVLGFSKGPTQAGALATAPHDQIAYKGNRKNVGKILEHVGLLPNTPPGQLVSEIDRLIANRSGRFHFSSFIRCTVERFDSKTDSWEGSGGGMLDRFVKTDFGRGVAVRCASRFLRDLPSSTKLVVMFGLGKNLNYVDSALAVFKTARPGTWLKTDDVTYSDGRITVVHVEHFASLGSLIPDWLGVGGKPRARLGELARNSVKRALA